MKGTIQRFVHFYGLAQGGFLFVALVFSVTTVRALDPDTKDPRAIAKASAGLEDGDKRTARSVWTITDSAGKKRKRTLQSWSIDFAGGTKTLMIYETPADFRNTGFLSIDYIDVDKEDDQWLYLPDLHRSLRIASANRSDSFLGTDLTYYDLSRRNVDANDYKLVAFSTKIDNVDCWAIEATPKTKKEKKESGYAKAQLWISKKTLLPLQIKSTSATGGKVKYITFSEIKKVDGIWTPYKIVVRTLKGDQIESMTTIQFTSIKLNQDAVKEEDFTRHRLEKGL